MCTHFSTHNGGAWKQLYKGINKTYTDTITQGWESVAYRVKAYDSDASKALLQASTVKVAPVGICRVTLMIYSLTEHDQTELMAQAQTVKEGAAAVPYHADGELCRMYPAEEFTALAQAATAHVFYHRTYCNHMNAWIARADLEELPAIIFFVVLLKKNLFPLVTACVTSSHVGDASKALLQASTVKVAPVGTARPEPS